MARVPITVMGYRCERCGHEWIPRSFEANPRTCPKCKSPYWDRPRETRMTYEDFRDTVKATLRSAADSLTWTEIRTAAGLPQMLPNNRWVRRMETDIGLRRGRDNKGIVRWSLNEGGSSAA